MDVENRLRQSIESFVSDLDLLMRRAALEAIETTFGGERAGRTGSSSGKRTSAQLQELQDQVLETISQNPGLRIEALSEVMNIPSRELTLPIRKLSQSRKIKKKGQKRATSYYAR